jgi:hypothetical protein
MSDHAFAIEETIAMLRKNRGGDVLRVALATVEKTRLCDVRQMFCPEGAQEYRATKKGFAIAVGKLDEVISALLKARERAAELGWLRDDGPPKAA